MSTSIDPLLYRGDSVSADGIRRLHPSGIESPEQIRALLERLRAEKVSLRRGMNRRIDPEMAWIDRVDEAAVVLRTQNLEKVRRYQLFLNFSLDGRSYFFAAPILRGDGGGLLHLELPTVVYRRERRDRMRRQPVAGGPRRVAITAPARDEIQADVVDASPEGIGVWLPDATARDLGAEVNLRFLDGSRRGERVFAEVRHAEPSKSRTGWTRIGLGVSASPRGNPLPVERRDEIVSTTRRARTRAQWDLAAAGMRIASDRLLGGLRRRPRELPLVRLVEYSNPDGEEIRAIVDTWGTTRGAPAVVIPPAWGRTKETLMPLALSIVASFRSAGEPVTVLRFDGVRKRGESYNDPQCRSRDSDHHRFTFSQGVRDIRATLDFLEKSPEFEPSTAILVSFSAASIESRRATAVDPRIRGWISVVGAADLQSMMRVISGGVDYAAGLERGVRFGLQDILGIEVDMDHAGLDAFREQLAYLEDARREMAAIQVPITWIHGRYDAWMDAERVKDALSRGDTSQRRFIEIPTGHMLKTSREALEAFQLIAGEVGRMALDRPLAATAPDLVAVEQRQRAERRRLSRPSIDTRSFWRDYLLGRDRKLGFELMTSIRPYANLMEHQVGALDLKEGHRVADLGSGTGSFPLHIARSAYRSMSLAVYQIDYLREGLQRARERLLERGSPPRLDVQYIESNLDVGAAGSSIPLGSQSVDSVLAALLVSYVSEPEALLCEIHRVLRRGGRLVLSSLRRDADMSKLYTEGLAELRAGRAREIFGRVGEKQLDDAARLYLNEASRLLDLEENGTFRFWDPPELGRIVRRAGFRLLSTSRSLGTPPQAVVLSAERL